MKIAAPDPDVGLEYDLYEPNYNVNMPIEFWMRYASWRTKEWYSYVLIGLAVFGLVTNIVTIVAIAKSKSLRKSPFHWLIVSLCCADIFSALFSGLNIAWFFPAYDKPFDESLAFNVGMTASYGTTLLVAAHVFLIALAELRAYKTPESLMMVKIVIPLTWFLVVIFGALLSASWFMRDSIFDTGNSNILYQVQLGIAVFLLVIGSLLMVFTIASVVRAVKMVRSKDEVEAEPAKKHLIEQQQGVKITPRVLSAFLIFGVFLMGFMPRCACFIYEFVLYLRLTHPSGYFAIWMVNTNMLDYLRLAEYLCLRAGETFQVLLYCIASRELRKAIKSLFCCGSDTQTVAVTVMGNAVGQHNRFSCRTNDSFVDSYKVPIVAYMQH